MSTDTDTDTTDVDEQARKQTDTAEAEALADDLRELLDSDMFDNGGSATNAADGEAAQIVSVAESVARQRQQVRQRYRRERREAREGGDTEGEGDDHAGPLAGTLGRVRAAVAGDTDTESDDTPEVVERDGRRVVVGECPIGAVDMVRLQALADDQQQDVFVRNEDAEAVERGPPANGGSDSPLTPKWHLNGSCSAADFSSRSYSRVGLGDARRHAIPCPRCIISDTNIRTLADALDAAPEFDSDDPETETVPYGERDRAGFLSGWPDAERQQRHGQIQRAIRSLDGEATAAEIAENKAIDATQQQVSTDLKRLESNRVAEHRHDAESGRTMWSNTSLAVTQ